MANNIVNFEDIIDNKPAGNGTRSGKELKNALNIAKTFLRNSTADRIERLNMLEKLAEDTLEYIVKVMQKAGVSCETFFPSTELDKLMNNDDDVLRRAIYEPSPLFFGSSKNGEKYTIGFMVPENAPETGEISSIYPTLERSKNGYEESFNERECKWELKYFPKDGFVTDDLLSEMEHRTQRGRFALDCLINLEAIGAFCSKTDFSNFIKAHEGLIQILEEFHNEMDVRVEDEGNVFLIPEWLLSNGIGIQWENGEFVLYQYLDDETIWDMTEPDVVNDYENYIDMPDMPTDDDSYEPYIVEVGRTKDFAVVENFIRENCIEKDIDAGDLEVCDILLPLSWNRTIKISYNNKVLNNIKYTLVQGGLSKEEKEHLRAFRNRFTAELAQYSDLEPV